MTDEWYMDMSSGPKDLMENVASVAAGQYHMAVIKTDGSLWTWGNNEFGQLGQGPVQLSARHTPGKVMDGVAAVSCGYDHTAIIKTDGSLWVWGSDRYGQLGGGWNTNEEHIGSANTKWPIQTTPVKRMDDVAAVNCGDYYTAVVKRDGSLWMWGTNGGDNLGNGWIGNETDGGRAIQTVPLRGPLDQVALPANAVMPSVSTVAGFRDVYEGDYYADAVVWAKERGVTGGTSADTFSPDRTVTRAEAVTFLWRAAGSPRPASAASPFADVTDSGAYYYDAVLWAYEQGVVGGVGNRQFSLYGTLTYDQILAMLCRAAGGSAAGGDWPSAAVDWAAENGLTDGLTFSAKGSCPRADVVYCLWKQLA